MNLIQRAVQSLRKRGLVGTLDNVLTVLTDKAFDWRHGTHTRGRIALQELHIQSDNVTHGVNYYPSRIRPFRKAMRLLNLPRANGFVDFGSGKGRILIEAASIGFRRVVGVEFSHELCEIARRNLQIFQRNRGAGQHIEIVEGDAALYSIADEDTIFYMFHPFDGAVMEKVMANIRQSLQDHPRKAFIVYHYPRFRDVIEKRGVFTLLTSRVFSGEEYVVYST